MKRIITVPLRISGLIALGLLVLPVQAEDPAPPKASAEKARLLEKLRQTRRGKPYSQPLDVHSVRPGVAYEKRNELIEEAQRFKEKDYRGTFQDMTQEPAKGIKMLEGAEDLQADPDPKGERNRNWLVPKTWDQEQQSEKDRLRKAWEDEHGPIREDPRNPSEDDPDREGGSLFERGRQQTEEWKKEELEDEDFNSEDQRDDILSIFSDEENDQLGSRGETKSTDGLEPSISDSALQEQPGTRATLDQLRQEPAPDQQGRNPDTTRPDRAPADYSHQVSGETSMDPYGSADTDGPALSRTQELLGRIARPGLEQRERERNPLPQMERLLPKRPNVASALSVETDRILGRNQATEVTPDAKPDTRSADPRFRTRLQGLTGSGVQGYQPSLQLNSSPLRPLTLSPPAAEVRTPSIPRPRIGGAQPAPAAPRLGAAPPGRQKPATTLRPRLPGLVPDRYRVRSRLGDKSSPF